jgi:hypothetical protein
MPRKPKPPPDDPKQLKRFKEMASEIGAGEHPERFDRVLEKVARSARPTIKRTPHSPRSRGKDESER